MMLNALFIVLKHIHNVFRSTITNKHFTDILCMAFDYNRVCNNSYINCLCNKDTSQYVSKRIWIIAYVGG